MILLLGQELCLTLYILGGDGGFAHQFLFLPLSQKFFPATYDETLCKFLFCTYEDSCNLIWSKKLSRGHVVDIYIAWLENCKTKNYNSRGILKEFFMKKIV